MKRNLSAFLLLDKPVGLSSNKALQRTKKLYAAKKAGHVGTLDPLASGLLPVCFGAATRFSDFLVSEYKTYFVTARLGVKTSTGDAEGEVVLERDVLPVTEDALDNLMHSFRGEITQIPPMYSALKHQGKPFYEYARQGIEIDRPARKVMIRSFSLVDMVDAATLSFEVCCSKGTYIRTLIEDLGEALGCGAHVIELRRTSVGDFCDSEMTTLDHLDLLYQQGGLTQIDKCLMPISRMCVGFDAVYLEQSKSLDWVCGRPVYVENSSLKTQLVSVYHESGEFLGVAEPRLDGLLKVKKCLPTSDFVFMS